MSFANTRKMTVTVPLPLYEKLELQARKAGISLNRYVVSRLDKRASDVIFVNLQELVCELHRLNSQVSCSTIQSEEVKLTCQSLRCLVEKLIAIPSLGRN